MLFSVSLRSQRDCYLARRAKFWQRNCEAVRRMGKTRSRGNIKTSRVCQLPFCWWKWLIKQGSVATKKDIALIRIHTETPVHTHWPGCWLPAVLIHIPKCICINMEWNKICSQLNCENSFIRTNAYKTGYLTLWNAFVAAMQVKAKKKENLQQSFLAVKRKAWPGNDQMLILPLSRICDVTVICVSPWYVFPRTHIPGEKYSRTEKTLFTEGYVFWETHVAVTSQYGTGRDSLKFGIFSIPRI